MSKPSSRFDKRLAAIYGSAVLHLATSCIHGAGGQLYVAGRLTIDRVVDLRRTRYIGLAKTHLQHVVPAARDECGAAGRMVRGGPTWVHPSIRFSETSIDTCLNSPTESCQIVSALLFLRLRKLEYQHRSATW
jgi:hypothetical protein